ncbi:hypothetical protein ACGIF2_03725 [Cellulomonas sp. P22]|uniref:hypothetical protein n=1 Tax=Cellulomonas sp. P22 TaxID=3373189 RepID=UPI0037A51A9C
MTAPTEAPAHANVLVIGASRGLGEAIVVDVIDAQRGVPGLQYLDRHGHPVTW